MQRVRGTRRVRGSAAPGRVGRPRGVGVGGVLGRDPVGGQREQPAPMAAGSVASTIGDDDAGRSAAPPPAASTRSHPT
ncbi:hypothetical protein BC477_01440 [Clavibacter michiganensis subsp. michiganensis]|uniref:Uncharacterized protein n=1 Tax=Clavibacter michiganensis subsp. michiganensis TaxID=33013 RepID=A0A251XJ84_CLAMM|nr:hypothetical protein BC477_01440 [Clavibacter michiganensis subsp. michiganensis]OUE03370.1 hypothetical protein CMMCAS07_00375 [Clavibacter michiganensis subsp. michiganensis]